MERAVYMKHSKLKKICILILSFVFILLWQGVTTAETLVKNHSFEDGLESWETNDSEAIGVQTDDWEAPGGQGNRLDYYSESTYEADTFQAVTDLENGKYILSAYVANDGTFNERYMYILGDEDELVKVDIPDADEWTQVELPFSIEDGDITIGFYADGEAGAWLGIDVVDLVEVDDKDPSPGQDDFIKGVDVSTLSMVEDNGGEFYDKGVKKDPLDIMHDYGSNYVRLKI